MPIQVLMPALSPTMEKGNLSKWLKKEGEAIKSGDVIAEIETDKATMEVEATDEGTLGKILIPEGTEDVAVNTPIATILADGESAADLGKAPAAKAAAPSPDVAKEVAESRSPVGEGKPMIDAPKAPAAPKAAAEPDPEVPEGTEMVTMTIREALRRDPDVFIMGEEVAEYQGAYKVSQGLLQEFGARRVIDTPITEHGFAGIGIGAAMAGLKPIVEFMTFNFAMQAMDQIINSAAKTHYMSGGQMTSAVVFRGPNGAAARVADAKGLLKAAIRDPNPVIFLENEILYGQSFDVPDDPEFVLPIGKAKIERPGKDVTIAAFSIMVGKALQAAEELAKQGIDAEVINLRSLRPFDTETIVNSIKKTNRLVSVEEGWPFAGIGAELAAQMMEHAFDWLDAPVKRVHGVDVPLPYAANLERMALPQPENIVEAARAVCNR